MLQIAIPNKGALSEKTVKLLCDAGYKCKRSGRELQIVDSKNGVQFFFLRPRDIAVYVNNGILDLGITGRDLAIDSKADVLELMPLNIGNSSFFYAIKNDSGITVDSLQGKRIATSYPNVVQQDLDKRGVKASTIRLDGAVEISIDLGVADMIADVVESGKTLKEAGLHTIGDPVLKSEAVIIARNSEIAEKPEVKTFMNHVDGILVARKYVMIEYNINKPNIEAACAITPGIESPTISPLSEDGWFAVKAMVLNKDLNSVIEKLAEINAKGITVVELKTCRI